MQKFHQSKKQIRIPLASTLSVLVLICAVSFAAPRDASAEKVNKLLEVQQKLRKVWNSISESKDEEKIISTNIGNINETINRKDNELKNYDRRMSQTHSEISVLAKDIETLSEQLDGRKQYLKEYINFLYKQQYGDNAFVLMSATDYQDLARKSKYISLIANYESRIIQKYIDDIEEINSKRKTLETLLGDIETRKEEARQKKNELQSELSRKDVLLARAREKQADYEKKAKELEGSSQRLQGMVTRLEKKAIPESITGNGFTSMRGSLPWPIHGRVVSVFGEYRDPAFNIPIFKNGIEIEAQEQESAKAVAGGRVIFASSYETYGMLLIIDHGNGYNTLYGNLSEIPLQKGDLLIQGTDLGKITKSKSLNTPALYFEIRYNGKPIDPLEWLSRHG